MGDLRFENRMSDSDALMWSIEKDPMLRSTIVAVLVLDRAPDRDRLHHLLERGARVVPRMRQRVRGNLLSVAPPRWETDPNFDLGYHVRWVRAAGRRDLRAVLDLAEPMAMQGFDRARPLWELVVVEDLADGGAAVIVKIHHAITDGVGAVQIALIMFELERDATPPDMPEAPDVEVMNQLARMVDAFEHERRRNLGIARRVPQAALGVAGAALTDPAGTAKRVAETVGSVAHLVAPANVPLSPLLTRRSLSVHFDVVDVPLAEAKAAAAAAGARLNDAFLAATAAGLRRYHAQMGAPTDALRLSMPINLRDESDADAGGNHFAPARFIIPIGIEDPVEAMATMRELVAHQRAEPALALVEPLARVLDRLPTSVSTAVFGAMLKGVDLVATNVPGAPIDLYTAGSRITSMIALAPMVGSALNLALLSYLDDIHIGVNVDPAAVTEPERMVACLRDGWEEVLAVGRPPRRPATARPRTPAVGTDGAATRSTAKAAPAKKPAAKKAAAKNAAAKKAAAKKAAAKKVPAKRAAPRS